MGDFSYLKECIAQLKELTVNNREMSNLKDQLGLIYTTMESQVFNLERFIENECRKRDIAEERLQAAEAILAQEKARREQLEKFGAKASSVEIAQEEAKQRRLLLVEEAKEIARETRNIALQLRRVQRAKKKADRKASGAELEHLWQSFKISAFVPMTLVISLEWDSSIGEGINLGALALPVYGDDEEVMGLLTLADMLAYIQSKTMSDKDLRNALTAFKPKPVIEPVDVTGAPPVNAPATEENNFAWLPTIAAKDVLAFSATPYWPIFMQKSISDVVNTFAKGHHVVAVCDEDQMIVNMVTPTLLVNILSAHIERMEPAMKKSDQTLEALGFVKKKEYLQRLQIMRHTGTALDALNLLHTEKRRAVGVVNAEGEITQTFSLSNFKALRGETLDDLLLSLEEFSQKYPPPVPIVCKPETTIRQLARMFVLHKPEHIWIVNSLKHPIGLAYVGDVLAALEVDWEHVGWN